MTTFGHLWVESRVHGAVFKVPVKGNLEKEEAMDTAEEVGAVGRGIVEVLRREIYEQVSTSENSSWHVGTPRQGCWGDRSNKLF